MTSLQKGTIWFVSWIVFIFALSVGLSRYTYGYFDVPTVRAMALMLVPLLAGSVVILVRSDRKAAQTSEAEQPKSDNTANAAHATSRSAS